MQYRSLGRTGVQVSVACLGTMTFGWEPDDWGSPEDVALRVAAKALDLGINFWDTADVYGRGTSETIVGKALRGKRDKVVLATKCHGKMADDDPNASGNSRRHIIEACEASLRRLGTDWIDLYQIHRPQPSIPIDETLRALDDLIRQGKVRYAGASTYAAWNCAKPTTSPSRSESTDSSANSPPTTSSTGASSASCCPSAAPTTTASSLGRRSPAAN
jgi:aryl-alcohol dehydrogenase-like predicted oxidoreductase